MQIPSRISIFLILAIFTAIVTSSFEGTWTDTYYGDNQNSCCLRGSKLYCFYAQIGIIVGSVSGNKMQGKWYEAGGSVILCSNGDLEWNLSNDGDSFTGTYTCADDPTKEVFEWNGSRISSNTPTIQECGALSKSRDISGFAVTYNTSICNGNGKYQSSFYLSGSHGYEEGETYESSAVGSGFYYETDGVNFSVGGSLFWVLEDGSQANVYRVTPGYGINFDDFTLSEEPVDASIDGYIVDPWDPENPSNSVCLANEDVKTDYFQQYYTSYYSSGSSATSQTSRSSNGNSSSASTISISFLIISFTFLCI